MHEELLTPSRPQSRRPAAKASAMSRSLVAGWRDGLTLINLRGDGDDPRLRAAVLDTLGLALPTTAGHSQANAYVRLVWAGPDDWFVLAPGGQEQTLRLRLQQALQGVHHALTDVSSGYRVLQLAGAPVREVLAQGCPLDLHTRVFQKDRCAGSHFFKASVWLWQSDDAPVFELLVRRSFSEYVWLMLERASAEVGLLTRPAA